jgi:general secretion pathway protein G
MSAVSALKGKSAERRGTEAGFSLLELMVVVVIMSILALVVMPRVINRPDQARVSRAISDLAVLNSAVLRKTTSGIT